jgi:colanic acid/amylovoran biosynthesis protein
LLNIEIKGVQFSNKGAELMLVAILEQLDKELGDYQITLSPGTHLPYQKRAR